MELKSKVQEHGGILFYAEADTELNLDITNDSLFTESSTINLKAIEKAFAKLPVHQAEPLT
ncbi:MAG: hypothetical protein IKQ43_02860 [Treponema sp.]|nr:hypothetical protein [Treponema sp.]